MFLPISWLADVLNGATAGSMESLGVGKGACWLSPCRRHPEVPIAHIHMHLTSWQEPLIIKCSASSGLNEAHSYLCPWILGTVSNRKGLIYHQIYLSTLQLCALVNCPFSTSFSTTEILSLACNYSEAIFLWAFKRRSLNWVKTSKVVGQGARVNVGFTLMSWFPGALSAFCHLWALTWNSTIRTSSYHYYYN